MVRDDIIDERYLTMYRKFMNPSSNERAEVPGKRALRKIRFANVTIKDMVSILPLQLVAKEDC